MTQDAFAWGDALSVVVTGSFFGWLFWAAWRQRRGKRAGSAVADEPEGTPYRVFTTEFDRVVPAREAPALIDEADRGLRPSRLVKTPTWPARLAAVERLATSAEPAFAAAAAQLAPVLTALSGRLTVMLLIDQSGSMSESILPVAATVRWLSSLLDGLATPLAVAGFTTIGWRGGAARREWIGRMRPERPGRLCALLHLRYRDFDRPMDESDWRVMTHPNVLRENIDGEAVGWAAAELATRPEPIKLLIVLSDGAPVDDATLLANGASYLVRHLRGVIADIEASGIRLGAIGIEHRVEAWYRHAADATDLTHLPLALTTLLVELLAPPC